MESTEAETPAEVLEEPAIKLRFYQEEMYERSLKRNVIVAMDTGSGKTYVAVYRIRAELERSERDKMVWFMCPSVALSMQQYDVLREQLSSYMFKDGVLINVRVVVGTPKVLEDALSHGFVNISKIALLVFDEAHRCIKDSPMNLVMRNFYHPAKARGGKVPHIHGLTASPVISAKSGTLETIEANLDAVTVTPKRHREELEAYVHSPQVASVIYTTSADQEIQDSPSLCRALKRAIDSYDLSTDPYVNQLIDFGDGRSQRQLEKQVSEPNTYCYKQLKSIHQRSKALQEQLRGSAAEWYVRRCIQRFNESVCLETLVLPDIPEKERCHLKMIFDSLLSDAAGLLSVNEPQAITDKVRNLIKLLLQHSATHVQGIVFVEQRTAVSALAYLLRSHPELRTLVPEVASQ